MKNQMNIGRNVYFAFLVLLLAIIGNGIWLYEIIGRFTWASLAWLRSPLYSPYLLSLFPAVTFLLPFILSKKIKASRILICLLLLYAVNLGCYLCGSWICLHSVSHWFQGLFLFCLLYVFSLYSLLGFCYWMIANKFIAPIKKRYVFLISVLAFLAMPLSVLTAHFYRVFGTGDDLIESIKLGYPVFWTVLLLGLAGNICSKFQGNRV